MTKVKRVLGWLGKWEYTWLCIFVLATLVTHFSIINIPSTPVFDEQHYIPDARSILSGNGTLRLEHPPLGKLFIVAGISLFGDNPFGWRFFSVMCGAAIIIFFYLACRRLAMSKQAAVLATFLLTLENMSFVQAGIAMLDVYSVVFAVAALWLYLRGNYPLAVVFVSLSSLGKLYGVLALGAIILHWLITRRDWKAHFVLSLLLAPISFVILLTLFEWIVFRHFVNPIQRIYTMLTLSSSLTYPSVEHISKSRPWTWVIKPESIGYYFNPNYFSAVSYTIWGLIIPSVVYMLVRAIKRSSAAIFGVSWFTSTYLVWIPLAIITDRVTYPFYFYPTVGAICLGVGLGLSQLVDIWRRRITGKLRWLIIVLVGLFLLAHTLVFAWLSPLSYWWGIPAIFRR